MKLHEALALLKEDGSNWIEREECEVWVKLKIQMTSYNLLIAHKYCSGKWEVNQWNAVPTYNWELHQEPKFKIGQPVAYIHNDGDFSLQFISQYDEKNENYRLVHVYSDVGKWDNLCLIKEENLLSMDELAEKLGDK